MRGGRRKPNRPLKKVNSVVDNFNIQKEADKVGLETEIDRYWREVKNDSKTEERYTKQMPIPVIGIQIDDKEF